MLDEKFCNGKCQFSMIWSESCITYHYSYATDEDKASSIPSYFAEETIHANTQASVFLNNIDQKKDQRYDSSS